MKKITLIVCLLVTLFACSSGENKAGSYTCTYGKKGDAIYAEVLIAYNTEQYATKFTFTQLVPFDADNIEEIITKYTNEMNQISGINASATYEEGIMRYHYSVNLSEYNTESDLLGVVVPTAQDNTLNMKQNILKKELKDKEYVCQ